MILLKCGQYCCVCRWLSGRVKKLLPRVMCLWINEPLVEGWCVVRWKSKSAVVGVFVLVACMLTCGVIERYVSSKRMGDLRRALGVGDSGTCLIYERINKRVLFADLDCLCVFEVNEKWNPNSEMSLADEADRMFAIQRIMEANLDDAQTMVNCDVYRFGFDAENGYACFVEPSRHLYVWCLGH